jgi:sporulation protein YlmC with PRC-barrel domain
MRLARSGVREAGIAGLRVASSSQRAIRKDVYDPEGQRISRVEDLYIDPYEREVRFLEVGAGGFLEIGKKLLLVPVEACVEVAEDRFTIEPSAVNTKVHKGRFYRRGWDAWSRER